MINHASLSLSSLIIDEKFYSEAKAIYDGRFVVVSTSAMLPDDAAPEECAKWFTTACSSGKVLLVTRPTAGKDSLLKSHAHRAGYGGLIVSADIKKLSDLETITNQESGETSWRVVYDPRQLVEGWPTIKPDAAETPLEPFPLESLPLPAQRFCMAVATAHSCDPGFPALFSISAMATAIGTSHQLRVKGGRFELPVLWIGISGRPGCGKSPAMAKAFAPLQKIQADLHDEYRRESAQFREDLERYKKSGDFDMPQKPVRQSVVVSNVTLEALILEMANSPRGTIFAADELAFWFQSLNAYKSGGGDRQWWLSSWSSVPVSYSRRNLGNETILIKRPCLGVVGGIQPDKLDILAGADDGLLGRFLLAAPTETRGEYNRDGLCRESEEDWDNFIQGLWKLPPESSGPGGFMPNTVELSKGAHDSFELFANGVTAELNEDSMPDILRGSWSKADTMVSRMALVIHMGKVVSGEESKPKEVSKETMGQAIELMQYFLAHMQRMVPHFHSGLSRSDKLRQRILEHIKRHRLQIRSQDGLMDWHELRHAMRRNFTTPTGAIDDRPLEQVLDGLKVTGHIKIVPKVDGNGRAVKPTIEVNPALLIDRV